MDHDGPGNEELWAPTEDGVPPVVGRKDPETLRPMMQYDTSGEVSKSDSESAGVYHESYETGEGVNVSISF
jgi:hypothetical protein